VVDVGRGHVFEISFHVLTKTLLQCKYLPMTVQKYQRGNIVRIAKTLTRSMAHFTADCEAIVVGSYADLCGGSNHEDVSYELYLIPKLHTSAWYHESQLTFVDAGSPGLIARYEAKRQHRDDLHGNMDWIISNWRSIRDGEIPSGTMSSLFEWAGITDPWGPRGEGITLYQNSMAACAVFDTPLLLGDKRRIRRRIKLLQRCFKRLRSRQS
jgi:hypothetical protein